MKKIIIGAFSLLLIAGAAQAQVKDKPAQQKGQPGANGNHQMAQNHLNLTETQKTQLKTLHEAQRKEMQELKKNENITVKEWKAKRSAIHDKYKAQYESILTPEQKAQVANDKKQHQRPMDKMKGMRGMERHHKDMARKGDIAKDLNLTEDQKQKMKDLRTGFKTKADAIRADKNLTQEQKRTQFQELMKQQREQMKTVLTKEQQEKIQSRMNNRKNRDGNRNTK